MSIFDVERKFDSHNLQGKLLYIQNPISSPNGLTFTAYVSPYYTFDEMILAKYCHLNFDNDTLNGRQFYEFIISLKEEESSLLQEFKLCTQSMVNFLATFDKDNFYQAIGCVHINTDNLHCHIIVNNIAFNSGKRLNLDRPTFEFVRNEINKILQLHGFSEIIYKKFP